jgi:hypothetical protein
MNLEQFKNIIENNLDFDYSEIEKSEDKNDILLYCYDHIYISNNITLQYILSTYSVELYNNSDIIIYGKLNINNIEMNFRIVNKKNLKEINCIHYYSIINNYIIITNISRKYGLIDFNLNFIFYTDNNYIYNHINLPDLIIIHKYTGKILLYNTKNLILTDLYHAIYFEYNKIICCKLNGYFICLNNDLTSYINNESNYNEIINKIIRLDKINKII